MYYIIYECDSNYETTVIPLEKSVDVTAFIEEKINKHDYSLADFKVIQGTEVNMGTIKTPTKVLILTA